MKSIKMITPILLHVWLLLIYKAVGENINYFGVAFQPYVKYGNPQYDTYRLDEIKDMLRLISNNNRHNAITTYSSGAADYNLNADCNYGNCIVARAAGQINREHNSVSITMAQGIYQHDDNRIMDAEINRAFTEAQEANQLRPGTVWGLVFTNEYINTPDQGNRVLDMLRQNKEKAKRAYLRFGVRIHICPQFYENGPLKGVLTDIVMESDFIMCNIYPGKNINNDVDGGVRQVVNTYTKSANAIRGIKNIEVMIGETGWASEGNSFFNSAPFNTVSNMAKFWEGIKRWASSARVKVHMFEAIDEPNKSTEMGEGERHFGWWYRAKDNSNRYVEKTKGKRVVKNCLNKI